MAQQLATARFGPPSARIVNVFTGSIELLPIPRSQFYPWILDVLWTFDLFKSGKSAKSDYESRTCTGKVSEFRNESRLHRSGSSTKVSTANACARSCRGTSSAVRLIATQPLPSMAEAAPVQQFKVLVGEATIVLKGEDRSATRMATIQGEPLTIALVADGHGGKAAAEYCAKTVIDGFLKALGEGQAVEGGAATPDGRALPDGKHIRAAGRQAFLQAHKMLHSDEMATTAGTTLTMIVVNSDRAEITMLHDGDSVARLVPRKSPGVALCEEHRLEASEAERTRVRSLGGQLAHAQDKYGRPAGPLRLWPGGVAQARAIGDKDVGHFIEPMPFARSYKLPEKESCAIVACSDGVWDVLLPPAVDGLVRQCLQCQPETTANLIITSALTQSNAYSSSGDQIPKDDTTCIVIRVEHADDPLTPDAGCCVVL